MKKSKVDYTYRKKCQLIPIPRNLSQREYYRLAFDFQFCTEESVSSLGDLSATPMSYGYKIIEMQSTSDLMTFKLVPRSIECPFEVVLGVIKSMNRPDVLSQIQKTMDRVNDRCNFRLSTIEEVIQYEKSIENLPYETDLQIIREKGCEVVEYAINTHYLHLMGITQQMMQEHISQSELIPHIAKQDDYIDIWMQFMSNVCNFSHTREIQNYNGLRSSLQQIVKQFFFILNGTLYLKMFWVYMTVVDPTIAQLNYEYSVRPRQCKYKLIQ